VVLRAALPLQTYSDTIAATDLIIFNGVTVTWTDFLTNLRAGTLYVNIHTTGAPGGLIRGQLLPLQLRGGSVRTSTFGGWWGPSTGRCNVPIT
jgi:hypothetical protein